MAPILEYLKLDKLIVHFEDSVCAFDCCNITRSAGAAFNEGFAKGRPRRLIIEGVDKWLDEGIDNERSIKRDIKHWTRDRKKTRMSLKKGFSRNRRLLKDLDEEEREKGEWEQEGMRQWIRCQ